ncbi:C2H2 type zinc-finger-domain-containing protein [Polychytrium aggregatum]|uniref:C2H2 type zinc-finger-domain-containing protein n=1 Tax=Polychytrium aggregatum TaxID=110093 RepID=UPI0022FEC2F3|nr:C2H2 type zinc-finger-domain-containing protein [Polychytrium aggregatum]KAI9202419.1 C2H2 type zinc-finger-domain-containing protein [Polychytrium aggregatum]
MDETESIHSETASEFSETSSGLSHPTMQVPAPMARSYIHAPRSNLYTCLACQVAFRSADQQREHYHSDWHRYNLKRKVAELPPVALEEFAKRLEAQQSKHQADVAQAAFTAECAPCRKEFQTENAYQNHLQSKKHKELAAKHEAKRAGQPALEQSSTESSSSADDSMDTASTTKRNWRLELASATTAEEAEALWEEKIASAPRLTETDCLFCTKKSGSLEANIKHMSAAHSFFIPDIEYLADLKGLLLYLGEKISVGNICLYCNGAGRAIHSLEAVRAHMIDKGHCKVLYEGDAEMELAEFYDFSSTWEDVDEDEDEEIVDADADNGDGEWEDASEAGNGPSSRSGPSLVIMDETQMVLPSGHRVGHRQFNKIWKQTLKPDETRDAAIISRLMGQYRELGCLPTNSPERLVIRDKMMQAKTQIKQYQDYKMRTGIKANKLQRHFRHQVDY